MNPFSTIQLVIAGVSALTIALSSAWLTHAVDLGTINRMKVEYATDLAKKTKAARDKDDANNAIASAMDKEHADKLDAINAAADAARDAAHYRGLWIKADRKCVPGGAANPGGGAAGTTEVRLPDATAGAIVAIARDADRAAEYARACHSWAIGIGRP